MLRTMNSGCEIFGCVSGGCVAGGAIFPNLLAHLGSMVEKIYHEVKKVRRLAYMQERNSRRYTPDFAVGAVRPPWPPFIPTPWDLRDLPFLLSLIGNSDLER